MHKQRTHPEQKAPKHVYTTTADTTPACLGGMSEITNLHQLLQRLQLEELTLSDQLLWVTLLEESSSNTGEK